MKGFLPGDWQYDLHELPQVGDEQELFSVASPRELNEVEDKLDCDSCPLKPRCCPTTPSRKVPRDVNEAARDHARDLMETEAYARSGVKRKKIETLFGDVKRNLGLTRLRLRGLTGARDEFLLVATVQNLKRLIAHATIPPPCPAAA